jgi:ABC-type sugar transport system permease subunit
MKNRSTYALLVQSEEKSRNIMETALYALFALSAVVSIWQFAQQPSALPLERVGTVNEHQIGPRIAS